MSVVHLEARCGPQTRTIDVPCSFTVGQVVDECKSQFGLETCKLVGLTKGKMPTMETRLESLHPPEARVKVMIIGVPRATLTALNDQESAYEVQRLLEAERMAEEARLRATAERRAAEQRAEYEAAEAVRRAEREERHRRDQAEWEARRREQEREARERELRAEQDVRNTFTFEAHAFHLPALDSSQKLLLPPHALQEIVNAKVSFPLTFQVMRPESIAAVEAETAAAAVAAAAASHTAAAADSAATPAAASASSVDESKMDTSAPVDPYSLAPSSSPPPIASPLVCYYAVADFSAPPSVVNVPSSLLRALDLTDGARIRLTTVNLPKATHLTIQPLTSAWMRVPELERRALLENYLRKRTFLVTTQLLTILYHPHLPTFEFRVVETRPAQVVSITDADVATEILPFDDGQSTLDASASSSSSASAAPAVNPTTPSVPKLVAGETVTGKLAREETINFQYEATDPNAAVTFDLRCIAGDVDLYVLNTDASETDVGVAHFTWAAQAKGSKTITLTAADPLFHIGTWQVQLRAYGTNGEFTLVVRESPTGSSSASNGHSLSSQPAEGAAAPPAADTTFCSNCRSYISARAMPLHSLQCARINFPCAQCSAVLKTNEKEKHAALVHSLYTCLCGVQLDQAAMCAHKRDSCPLRLQTCMYCAMKLVAAERPQHAAECGLAHSHCPLCAQSIQRKVMRRHLVREHGGVNGKTDERDITPHDFWQ